MPKVKYNECNCEEFQDPINIIHFKLQQNS